ncbi:MAG: LPS biosynthesis protein WbpP [Owenweeksia sp.]|nr:LPS biosynthesis protein WbpP [Owenweeksia sp.]MBF98736.1 LPS biosynthesis protein WbpP [Owenweeksia sp.]HBF19639.1 LPS biosynthesis protein WbpP [Cryomorphaceae bacterium]HCQ15427.1 LPS biosynthesis protein WbpP [Cryomorphaceae bacterium]|tara:strand:- start:2103 stop:3071 length:969 start_codon:yes stop_codon:yes gene_type:complete
MKKTNLLITGGAGFIGSNLVEYFLQDERVGLVRVLDDLSNGYYENIREFESHPRFEYVKGDICNYDTCLKAMEGIHRISHQAALGSVPRSIENPMRSTEVNILGTVNILHAAVEKKIERVILACSSSTYGDSQELPKVEDRIGTPLSPYAVTKFSIEQFADVFHRTYGLNYIGLRYFNVFGPRQNPDNPYAAVIPIFCKAFLKGERPTINGDGNTSRDFTYVTNAIRANELALFTENENALNTIYNTACGEQVTLNEMIGFLQEISGKNIEAIYGPERAGDVRHSKADISKISSKLGYRPQVKMREGLAQVYEWYKENKTFE